MTDPYDRNARLAPALLTLLPIIAIFERLYADQIAVLTNIAFVIIWCGGLYLLSNLSREFGKRLEPRLFDKWGGKPSTQLLRHRDTRIENITKKRYHSFLSSAINEHFPDPVEEASDPTSADEVYQSGVRWLLNKTRDRKSFALLFKENVSYGFKRNALGLKPFALSVCVACFVWIAVDQSLLFVSEKIIETSAFSNFTYGAKMALAFTAFMSLVWMFFFTEKTLKNQAVTYAETLLRACDELNQ